MKFEFNFPLFPTSSNKSLYVSCAAAITHKKTVEYNFTVAGSDLKLGLATAPVLFAARQYPHLNDLIQRRFVQQGDVEQAFQLVVDSDGLVKTKNLAQKHIAEAVKALETLTDSKYKQGLVTICDKVLNRLK